MKNTFTILVFLVIASVHSMGQGAFVPTGSRTYHLIDRLDIKSVNFFEQLSSSNKPYMRQDVVEYVNHADTIIENFSKVDEFNRQYLLNDNSEFAGDQAMPSKKPILKYFYREPVSLYHVDKPSFQLKLNPVIHLQFGKETDNDELMFINTRGVELRGLIDDKIGFYLYAADNQARFPGYVQDRVDETFQVMPGEGRIKKYRETANDFISARGYINFNVTKHVNVQFGNDRNFIGDGYRSLILSDYSKDYLFLKFNTRVWRINYQNIFAQMINYKEENIADGPIEKKYAAIHHLSIDVTRNFTFGFFETIMFGETDTLPGTSRGFELQYLNPLIFYRAVEFNLGSADNVMIGVDWKYNFLKRFSFYGQFVLDEFNFAEIRARNGWWANKFGIQGGLKYIDVLGLDNLDAQVEVNIVRPFTYAHNDNASSLTHFSQPLAHPLGANFREILAILRYQPIGRLDLTAKLIYAQYGSDTSSSNYGGNIFLPHETYTMEFGNSIGQGVSNTLFIADLMATYQPFHNIFADLRLTWRKVSSDLPANDYNRMFVSLGVRVNVNQRNFDF